MKTLLVLILTAFTSAAQSTGDYVFTRKAATGYSQKILAPETGKSLGWDSSGNPVNIAPVTSLSWDAVTGKPTTLSGYGITDAAASSHTHSLSNLTQSGATAGQVPTWNGSAWAAEPTGYGRDRLWAFHKAIDYNGGTGRPVILRFGDSMIGTTETQLSTKMRAEYGDSGGYVFGAFGPHPVYDDYDWISGYCTDVYNGEVLELSNNGNVPVLCNTLKIITKTTAGGGSYQVQLSKNGGAWTDEGSPVSTSGALGSAVTTITKTDWRATWRMRIVATGTVRLIGFAFLDLVTRGCVNASIYNSSNSSNNIDMAAACPRAVTDPIFADISPNLIIISHYDGEAMVNSSQSTLQDNMLFGCVSGASTATDAVGGRVSVCSSADTLTASNHKLVTGTPVRIANSGGVLPTGLNANTTYWVIRVSTNTFKLAISKANAFANIQVSITSGTGSGTNTVSECIIPSFLIIGPPCGYDAATDLATAGQAAAQHALAQSRGDAFFDNRKWAIPYTDALANGFIQADDVHYTAKAVAHWVPKMFTETGLADFMETSSRVAPFIKLKYGGIISAVRGNAYNSAELERRGAWRIAPSSYNATDGQITMESYNGASSDASKAGTIRFRWASDIDQGFQIIPAGGSTSQALEFGAPTYRNGGLITSVGSTAATPTGMLGSASKPFAAVTTARIVLGYRAVTANYSITEDDHTIDVTANSVTVTLPSAATGPNPYPSVKGTIYRIRNSGAGTVTIATTSSQTIDGTTPGTLSPGQKITLQSTGANWITL